MRYQIDNTYFCYESLDILDIVHVFHGLFNPMKFDCYLSLVVFLLSLITRRF